MPNLTTITCQNCGREFKAKACRLNTKYGVKYCSRECYINYYKIHRHPALSRKPKVKLTCKKCGKIFEVKPSEAGMSPKGYRRKYCSQKCALTDIHRSRKGSHRTMEEKQKMRERFKFHKKVVIEQAEILKQQGFKVIIVDKVRPDIIARKDDKIYAVEVELDKPDYGKYEGIEVFDDIMWIFKDYTPKFQRPA